MNITTTRRFRRTRSATRIMRTSLGLTMIPANLIPDVSRSMDLSAAENLLNRRPKDWSSPQSPDELVIQKRGRRKSIIWSPDVDTYKRHDLLSLSSRDRTPTKSISTSDITLKSTPRKRLSFIDTYQSEFVTPEKKMKLTHSLTSLDTNILQKQSINDLAISLRGLSHEQLVDLIISLVHMQKDGILHKKEKLYNILLEKMPVADVQPLIHILCDLKQHIYTSLTCCNSNNSTYNGTHIYLDLYEKTLVKQGSILQESQHWISLIRYVLAAWEITRELPEWNNQGLHNITHKCFKSLSQFCIEAIKRGNFETSNLKVYIESFKSMAEDCEDFKVCLRMVTDGNGYYGMK